MYLIDNLRLSENDGFEVRKSFAYQETPRLKFEIQSSNLDFPTYLQLNQ